MMGGEMEKRGQSLSRSSNPSWFYKALYQNISQNSQENTFASVSFLINLRTMGVQLY